MRWTLPLSLVASVCALCNALPAPDGTTAAVPATTPGYVDTIQSIQCIGSDRIQLTFQNPYSFMDAWDWSLPRAVLINGDVESITCDEYKGLGAAWLTSNTANTNLYQQCRSGGACIVEFNMVQADGTFKDLLVNYLAAQNLQIQTTAGAVSSPTLSAVDAQPSAPQYTVDPWQAKQWSDIADQVANGANGGSEPAGGTDPAPSGGGGYQRWQEIANEYEKQVQNLPNPDDASKDLKPTDENLLQEQAENTATDLAKGSLEANAEAIGGYMATTFLVAGIRALLIKAAESTIAKTLVQQFVKLGIQEMAAPLTGAVLGGAAAAGGEIAGAGVAAVVPVAGEIVGAVILIFSEIQQIEDLLKTPDMNQDYQVGEFQLTGPNGKEYWVVEQGTTTPPAPYQPEPLPPQFKSPFYFVPPQMVFDPTNVGSDGALKDDPWPKMGWKSYDPQVGVSSIKPIGTLGNTPEDGGPTQAATAIPAASGALYVTYDPQNGGKNQPNQPVDAGPTPNIQQPNQSQGEPNQTKPQTEPQTTPPPSTTSNPLSSTVSKPQSSSLKCLVPTSIQTAIQDLSRLFPSNTYSKTFTINQGQSNEVSFKCSLACANCSLTFNHKTVLESVFGSGRVEGDIDLHLGMELSCTALENWKDLFKAKASKPLIWGFPAYKKMKKVWQGAGPMCSDFSIGSAFGLSFVPFKGKVNFGFEATKSVSLPIPAMGDDSQPDTSAIHSDWQFSADPIKFSGFGLPSLAFGLELTADWGWGLEDKTPLFDAGINFYPNATFQIAARSAKVSNWGDTEVQECELPFIATAGEKPWIHVSAMGQPIYDQVITAWQATTAYTYTAGCWANYNNVPQTSAAAAAAAPAVAQATTTPTAVATTGRYANGTLATITRTSSTVSSTSSSSSTDSDLITAWPWPDPTFSIGTDMFANIPVSTEYEGSSINLSYLSQFATAGASVISNSPSISTPVATTAPQITPPSSVSLPTTKQSSSTNTGSSALASVTGVFNTDASCGYGQGACSDGYHCLKVWPVEVAQSYMCGKPDMTGFDSANMPSDYSPPDNNGLWACSEDAQCYPTCGYLGALFDPAGWTCANPIDNAVWECTSDDGSTVVSSAASNSATQCKMICQPGFGMNTDGQCVDILTDSKNCGQVGYDCSFGYSGYYASTPACAMGQCVNLCPSGSTPFVNLCLNYLTDTFNCGSFGNQCNVANQEACKNGVCVQCYECYGSI